MSNGLFVKLYGGTTREAHDAAIILIQRIVPTAEAVMDIDSISRATLDGMLLPPEQSWDAAVKRKVSRRQRVQ